MPRGCFVVAARGTIRSGRLIFRRRWRRRSSRSRRRWMGLISSHSRASRTDSNKSHTHKRNALEMEKCAIACAAQAHFQCNCQLRMCGALLLIGKSRKGAAAAHHRRRKESQRNTRRESNCTMAMVQIWLLKRSHEMQRDRATSSSLLETVVVSSFFLRESLREGPTVAPLLGHFCN